MDFAGFIAPIGEDAFRRDYLGQRPLHLAGGEGTGRAALFDWDALGRLLAIAPQWADGKLRMVMNSRPVVPEHYSAVRETARGQLLRPDPALVAAMMDLGASLVLDGLEDADAGLQSVAGMLGRTFAAKAGVNLYASAAGVQAFASHCDPHDVFVVHCAGTKRWRIYANRADNPVTERMPDDQQAIDREKGAVMLEPELDPGDLLYIPRGLYHDAVASSDRSLHLTFAVQPLYGVAVLDLVRDLALDMPQFRAFLADARDETAIGTQLDALAEATARLIRTPALREDIAVRQRTLAPRQERAELGGAGSAEVWRRTGSAMAIEQPQEGSRLVVDGKVLPLGLLSDAAGWIAGQQAFSTGQLLARFSHHPADELRGLLAVLRERGAIGPYS